MHAFARKTLFEPIERKMVGVLADDDVRQKAGARQSLLDHGRPRAVASRRYHDAPLLARARVFDPRRSHAHERRRPIVELLARLFANRVHRVAATAARPLALRRMDLNALDRQMLRQSIATVRATPVILLF